MHKDVQPTTTQITNTKDNHQLKSANGNPAKDQAKPNSDAPEPDPFIVSPLNYTGPHAAASSSLNNSTPNAAAPPEAPTNTGLDAAAAPPVLENSEPEVTTTSSPLDNSKSKTTGTSSST